MLPPKHAVRQAGGEADRLQCGSARRLVSNFVTRGIYALRSGGDGTSRPGIWSAGDA